MAFAIVSVLTIASAATSLYVFRTVAVSSQADAERMTARTAIAAEINRRSEHVAFLTENARDKIRPVELLAAKVETIAEVALIRQLALKLPAEAHGLQAGISLDEAAEDYGRNVEKLFDILHARRFVTSTLEGAVKAVRREIALSLDQLAIQSIIWTDQFTSGPQDAGGNFTPSIGEPAGVKKLLRVNALVTRLQAIDSAVLVAGAAASRAGLGGARNRAALNLRDILRLVGQSDDPGLRAAMTATLTEIVAALNDTDGVFSMASAGIEIQSDIAAASNASLVAARALELATEGHVEQTALQVSESLIAAEKRLKNAEIIVISFTLLAFAASVLTVWLIVYQDIVRRAQRLIRAARRLAGGDLSIAVIADGGDELTDLALALELFRQNAQQVREQERALFSLNNSLTRKNEELEQFAFIASHDLQEPLRIVVSYSELLEQRYSAEMSDDAREFMGYSVDAARRMRSLIDDLLTYSRLNRNNAPPQRVALMDVVAVAKNRVVIQGEESAAIIDYKDLPDVQGIPMLLNTVFEALFDNAIKFAGDKHPTIQVTAAPEGDFWRITVSDNGIGIDDMQRDRIFRIFQRLHTRTEFSGNGVGLTICRRIVEMHGGEIHVESIGKSGGTAVSFTLPMALQENLTK